MEIRKILFLLLTSTLTTGVSAQQLPQYSQYMQNMYVLNPAASCLNSDIDINLGFRQQWAGFDGAPQTYYLSGSINLGKRPSQGSKRYSIPISYKSLVNTKDQVRHPKHVVGGLLARDEYGFFKKTSFMASYSYHHPVFNNSYIAIGTSLGWYGLQFNTNDVVLEQSSDNTYSDFIANGNRSNLFDLNFGAYFYSDRFFAGYSIYQVAQNEINLGDEATPINLSQAKLKIHHFATVGYAIPVGDKLDITPSLMFKIQGAAPLSYDINLRAEYIKKYWLGVSYRNEDAISAMAGLKLNEWLKLGYSYDFLTSKINNLSSGSHEIVLGILLDRKN